MWLGLLTGDFPPLLPAPAESFPDAEQEAEADAGEPRSPGAVPHRAHGGHLGR